MWTSNQFGWCCLAWVKAITQVLTNGDIQYIYIYIYIAFLQWELRPYNKWKDKSKRTTLNILFFILCVSSSTHNCSCGLSHITHSSLFSNYTLFLFLFRSVSNVYLQRCKTNPSKELKLGCKSMLFVLVINYFYFCFGFLFFFLFFEGSFTDELWSAFQCFPTYISYCMHFNLTLRWPMHGSFGDTKTWDLYLTSINLNELEGLEWAMTLSHILLSFV